ncbi:hypothetical protein IWQ56_007174 [Coemansia nantahalensis]|uniref:Uncharacterized protein n=2 Tax=Coemansia TaxID=4863 RepID=A0ACC1K2M9_9FUNG|nr:hypothetical protein IWQ56_007174 [Coemansia nantahalensis]KAJ2772079.1 hypothetical protein IWQ57_001922 [Coemansia nantahalensis]
MLSSARSLSKQVLNHRTQIQQQTKTQLRNQHNGTLAKERHDDEVHAVAKMRQENRERKKRWRELNEERNKDNDLRCRVNKRANQLYGAQASAAKEKWIGEEFERRQQRRRDKEQRKRQQHPHPHRAAGLEKSAAEPAQQDAQTDAGGVRMPAGFGPYSSLPSHQVRAANDFWRSVAAHRALETAAPAEPAVRLPPLSSVVPEELLHAVRRRRHQSPAAAAANPATLPRGHVAPLCSGNAPPLLSCDTRPSPGFDVAYHMTRPVPSPPRHLRPWEDACFPPSPHSPDVGRLSEAAFSLMTLSSSPMPAGPPTPP